MTKRQALRQTEKILELIAPIYGEDPREIAGRADAAKTRSLEGEYHVQEAGRFVKRKVEDGLHRSVTYHVGLVEPGEDDFNWDGLMGWGDSWAEAVLDLIDREIKTVTGAKRPYKRVHGSITVRALKKMAGKIKAAEDPA